MFSLGSYKSVRDIMWVYENHRKVYKIARTQTFIPIILFLVKKMVKKGYYKNESLSLACDGVKV